MHNLTNDIPLVSVAGQEALGLAPRSPRILLSQSSEAPPHHFHQSERLAATSKLLGHHIRHHTFAQQGLVDMPIPSVHTALGFVEAGIVRRVDGAHITGWSLTADGRRSQIEPRRENGAGPGAGICLWVPQGGFTSIGRPGLPSERVAEAAVKLAASKK